jgi:methyltransferase family protein
MSHQFELAWAERFLWTRVGQGLGSTATLGEMDWRYGREVVVMILSHPMEAAVRVQQRRELRHWSADLELDYGALEDWDQELHRQLGLASPCEVITEYEDLYATLKRSLPGFPHGHDADPALAKAIWCITCHAGPDRVAETGVARGISSRFILAGLARNRSGHLWSIDLPPLLGGFRGAVGAAVPDELRRRWTYVRGPSRHRLPRLLDEIAPIDVFVQDSVGTRPTVLLELGLAWEALRPRGLLVVNAINRSDAFGAFLERVSPPWCVIGRAGLKRRLVDPAHHVTGQFAIVMKH